MIKLSQMKNIIIKGVSLMKKFKYFSSFMLIFSIWLGLFANLNGVMAQAQNTSVAVDVDVLLALYGNEPINQEQISYDIVQFNPETNTDELVYRYESTNPPAESLILAEGAYTFRLYDGGQFVRDGNELLPYSAEMTDPNALAEDGSQTQTLTTLDNSGSINGWEDGTVVLDVPFEVTVGDNLYNPVTNQYESKLIVTIADADSAATLPDTPENPDEAENPEQPTEEVGTLILHVVADDSSFVEGAVIAINGEEYQTDAQGLIHVEGLPVGQAEIELISLPEAFTSETTQVQPAEIIANSTNNSTLTVQRVPEEATTNTVVLSFTDGFVAVPNVSVTINNREQYSDAQGDVVFTDVPVGDHTITINSVPTGYFSEWTTSTISVNADEPSFATIQLGKEASGSVLLQVVNESSEAVSGVEIQINETVVTTDESGQARVENLTQGGYTVTVLSVPEGYDIPEEDSVNVDLESQTEKTITLSTSQSFGSALINIVDDQDNPVVGAEILINNENTFVSNGQGQIIIEDLDADSYYEYYITALPEGYELDGEAETRGFTVLAEQQVEDTMRVNLADQFGSISFTILDEANVPIEGAIVAIGLDTLTTDASGVVTFNQLAVGEHSYEIRGLDGRYEGALNGQVIVEANATTEEVLNLTFVEQLGSVTFNIVDQNNEAVEAAEIELNGQIYTTDSNGQVTIEDLTVGQNYNYTLNSLPENYSGQASGVVIPSADAAAFENIIVEREIPLGQLTITVVDQNNQAVDGAEIQLNQSTTATTNSQGQVVFTDLQEATYEYAIQSLPDNYEDITNPQSVYIAEGASEVRQLQVRRNVENGSVIFNVRDQDEHPVEGVVITIADKNFETNTEGTATASDIEPGNHTYTITSLSEGYQGEVSGQVSVSEAEITTVSLHVEREVELSEASLMIVDQNDQPIPGVNLSFGGLTGLSNSEGLIHFESLEPGTYNYTINNVPEGYENTFEGGNLEVEEGSEYNETIDIVKLAETGTARIHITADGQAVEGVTVTINGEAVSTDNEGYASFDELEVGSYSFVLSSVPEGFELGTTEGKVQVVANEVSTVEIRATVIEESSSSQESSSLEESSSSEETSSQSSSESQSSSVIVDESHSLTPQEQASIDEEASQATRQFRDSETGIEVWVNPQDASKIETLSVEKLTSSPAIENADADIYRLTLLDSQNNSVQLTKIAEVKIPTRPVSSQLRVVRLNNNSVSNLTFALHNQRVTFRTQQLGDFGIVYNAAQASISDESDPASVSVSVESSVEEKDLPNTGERSSRHITIMLAISLVCIAYLIFTHNNKRKDA